MNTKLYVGNLSYDTGEAKLRELFSPAGTIRSVTIPMDRMTNQPRGFAFVEMESPADALKAIKLCNGQEVDGREIKVNEAKPQEARTGGGGGDRGPRRSNQNRW
ncbi:MAG: RNA-binding protein [Chloroflexi bacterium]|nr:RNA-binding protein [Chloroflexota bacterium]